MLAGLLPLQAVNLALKRCLCLDLALLKTLPLPLFCCYLELSVSSTRVAHCLPLPVCAVGSIPLQRTELTAAPRWLMDSYSSVLAPGSTLDGRRGGDP